MPTPFEPNIGQWYQDQEGRSFEVVAMDDMDVEIQYYDGEVDEFDVDTWYLLNVNPTEAPPDWEGPFETALNDENADIDSYLFSVENAYSSDDLIDEVDIIGI